MPLAPTRRRRPKPPTVSSKTMWSVLSAGSGSVRAAWVVSFTGSLPWEGLGKVADTLFFILLSDETDDICDFLATYNATSRSFGLLSDGATPFQADDEGSIPFTRSIFKIKDLSGNYLSCCTLEKCSG